jgi:hypothetical protein
MTAQQDPLLKSTIRDRMYALLYVPADTRMFDRIKAIIVKNAVRVGASHASFMYKAVNYSCDDNKILPRPRNQLHVSMEEAMQEYLRDDADLKAEKPFVQAYLTQVLNASDHPEDWLLLLPASLHKPVRDLIAEKGVHAFTGIRRMTGEGIAAFLATHKEAANQCKQRLVTNLITT